MTLILNEIHIRNGLSDTFQIAAADRRITREDKIEPPGRKLFTIPYLGAVVSYFGLASFIKAGKEIYLSDWLPDFIKNSNSCLNRDNKWQLTITTQRPSLMPDELYDKRNKTYQKVSYQLVSFNIFAS